MFSADANFKSNNILELIIVCAKVFICLADMKKINLNNVYFRKKVEIRYRSEAHNPKLKLTLPVFLSDWFIINLGIMLKKSFCGSLVVLHLLPVLFSFLSLINMETEFVSFLYYVYRMEKNLI